MPMATVSLLRPFRRAYVPQGLTVPYLEKKQRNAPRRPTLNGMLPAALNSVNLGGKQGNR